jgi:hypothetical protein
MRLAAAAVKELQEGSILGGNLWRRRRRPRRHNRRT